MADIWDSRRCRQPGGGELCGTNIEGPGERHVFSPNHENWDLWCWLSQILPYEQTMAISGYSAVGVNPEAYQKLWPASEGLYPIMS